MAEEGGGDWEDASGLLAQQQRPTSEMEVIDLVDDEEEEEFDYGEGIGGGDDEEDDEDDVEILGEGGAASSQRSETYSDGSPSSQQPEGAAAGAGAEGAAMEEEAAARTALIRAAEGTGDVCWWCSHPELAGSWLRAFVCAGEAATGDAQGQPRALFEKLKSDTYGCLPCQDAYGEARRMVLGYLQSRDAAPEAAAAMGRLAELDRAHVLAHLREAHSTFFAAGTVPEPFVYCLFDLLVHAELYLGDGAPPEIDHLFSALMAPIGGYVDLDDVQGRSLPGIYLLLTHPNVGVRSFAGKIAKQIGQVSLDMFEESVAPSFKRWYQVLEEDYLQWAAQQPPAAAESAPGARPDRDEVWKALRCLLEQVGARDTALGEAILAEFPLLADIVLQHAEEATAPPPAGGAGAAAAVPVRTQRVAIETLRLMLDRFGAVVWRHADGASAGATLEWLRARLLLATAASSPLPEPIFVGLLHLLRSFLRSLPHGGGRDRDSGIGLSGSAAITPPSRQQARRASLLDSAIRALARLSAQLPVTALTSRRFVESTLCEVVADAYDPAAASAADWPLASADSWAPLLVAAMGPFGTVDARKFEERARASVLLVVRQHAADVRDRVLELARGGSGVADDDDDDDDDDDEEEDGGGRGQGRGGAASGRRDFFCRRLLGGLCETYPLHQLPADIRECLFSIQSNFYLAMPLRRQLRGSSSSTLGLSASGKRAFIAEARACLLSFQDLLVRYTKVSVDLNPIRHGPVALASVVPLLLLGDDDAGLKNTLLILLARAAGEKNVAFGAAMDWSKALAAVTRQEGAPLLGGLWQGAAAVAKDLRKAGVGEGGAALAVIERFLELLGPLAAALGAGRLKEVAGLCISVWWRLGLELLGKARQRFEGGQGPGSASAPSPSQLLSPPLLRSFCEVTRAFLPGLSPARLREHAAWLALLLDWANDPRAAAWDAAVHHGMIELLLALLRELRGRGVALKQAVGGRVQRLASGKPGAGAEAVQPLLGRRLRALVDGEGLPSIEGQEVSSSSAAVAAGRAPAALVVDISRDEAMEVDKDKAAAEVEEEEGKWPFGPTSPTPPSEADDDGAEEEGEAGAAPASAAAAAVPASAAAASSRAAMEVIEIESSDEEEDEEQGPRRRKTAMASAPTVGAPTPATSASTGATSPPRQRIVLSAGGKRGAAKGGASARGRELLAPPKAKQAPEQSQAPCLYQQRRQSVEALQAGVARPAARTTTVEDEFALFRHLKESAKRAPQLARAFHGHVLRWSLPAIMERDLPPGVVLDQVPLRFRDARHYVDTFVPLVLEELRAGLGGTLQEGLRRRQQQQQFGGPAAGGGRGRGRRHDGGGNSAGDRVGETTTLDLERAQVDGEKDGLATLQLRFDYRRNTQEGRLRIENAAATGGQDIFVLRPVKGLEDGEWGVDDGHDAAEDPLLRALLADGRDGGGGGRRAGGNDKEAGAAAAPPTEPHLLAVLLDIDQQDGGGDVWRLRAAVAPHAPAAGGTRWSELKPSTRWKATLVGSLTTSLREFAAVHELLELRLAPRLLTGGKGQLLNPAQSLTEIDLAGLVARGKEIEALLARCEGAEGGGAPVEALRQKLRALRWLRISQRLLKESKVGVLVKKRCSRAPWAAIQEVSAMVLQSWKAQVEAEKACYEGGVDAPVLAGGVSQEEAGGDSQSQTIHSGGGGGDDAAARRGSMAPSDDRVRCPIQLPLGLFKVLRAQFNSSQLRSICAATHIHSNSFKKGFEVTLLQGPPGTGKTKTIIGLLSALVNSSEHWRQVNSARRSSAGTGFGGTNIRPALRPTGRGTGRILVCAPSNGAVDEITLRLWRTGLLDSEGRPMKLPICRVGAVDDDADADLRAASLDVQVQSEVESSPEQRDFSVADAECVRLRAELAAAMEAAADATARRAQSRTVEGRISEQEFGRDAEMRQRVARGDLMRAQKRRWEALRGLEALRSRIRCKRITEAKIVLSTLSSAAVPYLTEAVLSSAKGFETAVVDEAGQAVEPSSLIPLKYGARNLVLVGDPRQLPATVLSMAAPKRGYDRSLFERLETSGVPVWQLLVQYRMDPEIRAFPSATFYEDKLRDAPSVLARGADPASPSVFLRSAPYFPPYLLIDVAGGRESTPGGERSIANEAEAALALGLCQRLWLEFPQLDSAEHVAVITPYRSQVAALHRCFSRALGDGYARRVELSTVDGYQGREATVIILSCVRTRPGKLGFITDLRRLNVALTRARHSLFVLGRCEALASHETWRALIEDAAARRCLVRMEGGDRGFDDVALRLLRESASATGGHALALPTTARAPPPALARAPSSTSTTGAAATMAGAPAREPAPRRPSSTSSSSSAHVDARKGSGGTGAPVLARASASSPGMDAMFSGLIDRAEASAAAAAAASASAAAAAAAAFSAAAAAPPRRTRSPSPERRPPASTTTSRGPSVSARDEAAIEAERARRQRAQEPPSLRRGGAGDTDGWLPRRPMGGGGGSKRHARRPTPAATASGASSAVSSSLEAAALGRGSKGGGGSGKAGGSAATSYKYTSGSGSSSKSSKSISGSKSSGSSGSSRKRPAEDETLVALGTSKRKIGSGSSKSGGSSSGASWGGGGHGSSAAAALPPRNSAPLTSSSSSSSSSAPAAAFVIPKRAGAGPSSRAVAAAAAASATTTSSGSSASRPAAALTGKKPNKKPTFSLSSMLDDM